MAMSLAVGGLAQLLAGMWEFACGNTFGATMFTSYGGFFISYGIIYWPSSGYVVISIVLFTLSLIFDRNL